MWLYGTHPEIAQRYSTTWVKIYGDVRSVTWLGFLLLLAVSSVGSGVTRKPDGAATRLQQSVAYAGYGGREVEQSHNPLFLNFFRYSISFLSLALFRLLFPFPLFSLTLIVRFMEASR